MGKQRINLIMAGGGVRLGAFVGALDAFRKMNVEVVGIAGASGGSIVGSYLAAGWDVERLYRLVMETDFAQFKDVSLTAMLFQNGVCSGNRFDEWMDSHMAGLKFRDLDRDLFVTATDLIGQEPVIFSRYATPEVLISRAVRYSISFPGMWSARRWDGKILVDGNLIPWIPKMIDVMQTRNRVDRTVTLCLMTESTPTYVRKQHLWPWEFFALLLETMGAAMENQRVPAWLWPDTILIKTGNIQPLQFGLTTADKERLVQYGYDQVTRYFNKNAPLIIASKAGEAF
jgi:NTE family protein